MNLSSLFLAQAKKKVLKEVGLKPELIHKDMLPFGKITAMLPICSHFVEKVNHLLDRLGLTQTIAGHQYFYCFFHVIKYDRIAHKVKAKIQLNS